MIGFALRRADTSLLALVARARWLREPDVGAVFVVGGAVIVWREGKIHCQAPKAVFGFGLDPAAVMCAI